MRSGRNERMYRMRRKICDNCMKCLQLDRADYRAVEIDDIIMNKADTDGYDELDGEFEEEETDNFFLN